jgi:hypothetical protein
MNEYIYNEAFLWIITRARLENRMFSRAIISELLKTQYISFGDLHYNVCNLLAPISEHNFRNHIVLTNDYLKNIDNSNRNVEVLVARIHDITVEVEGEFYTRLALVHNVR